MDKFANFLTQAKNDPDLLGQLGGLLGGLQEKGKAGGTAMFEGVAGLAEKFGIDLTPDDVAEAQEQAQAKDADADDGFSFDDLPGMAAKFIGLDGGSGDGFGLDDIGGMVSGLFGGDKNEGETGGGGFDPLDMLVSMFKK